MLVQVPIFEILHKYDGVKVHDDIKLGRRRYKFMRLPRFLAMHMKRFTKNNFYVRPARLPTDLRSACHLRSLSAADLLLQTVLCCALAVSLCLEQLISKCVLRAQVEKNPTIVNFPVKNLLLKDVMPVPTGMCFSRLCPQLRSLDNRCSAYGKSSCDDQFQLFATKYSQCNAIIQNISAHLQARTASRCSPSTICWPTLCTMARRGRGPTAYTSTARCNYHSAAQL